MKVMLVVPHLSDGGGERIVSDLSFGLQADDLILAVFEEKVSYPFKGRLVSLNLAVDRRTLLSRASGFLRRVWAFRQLLRRERPDVVVSFMGEANLINALVSRRPVLSVHNLAGLSAVDRASAISLPLGIRKRVETTLATGLAGLLYRRATVVAVSGHVQSEIVRRFKMSAGKVVVIPNAVNVNRIKANASEPLVCPWPAGTFVVITAGRLTHAKGQWHLIRAFAESRKRVPMQLVILGAGELEKYLKNLAEKLGMESDVYFLGWQPNPHKFMARADLFVLPSLTEGFGLVLLEAMACGLPVVTANCPGPPADIVAPGVDRASIREPIFGNHGVVVPALDGRMQDAQTALNEPERMLADVLVRLAREPELREACKVAAQRRVADFSFDQLIFKYQQLISEVSRSA